MFRGLTFFGTQCSYTVCQSDYIMHIMLMQAAKEFLTLKLARQTAITIMQEAAAQKTQPEAITKAQNARISDISQQFYSGQMSSYCQTATQLNSSLVR